MSKKLSVRIIGLVAVSFIGAVVAQEWNHDNANYDKNGAVQLKDAAGNTWSQDPSSGYKGLSSASSPTVLSVVNSSSSNVTEIYNISDTPAQSNYRANLYEPLVVGSKYLITGYYHRTGSSGGNYSCIPTWAGSRIIEYTGPGQVVKIQSSCIGGDYANNKSITSTFTISSDTTIDGRTTGNNHNAYYGYTMDNIVSVKTSTDSSREIYSIAQTPAQSNYRANLYEPLVVGKKYDISGYYYRTGSSGGNYACVPTSPGSRTIEYTGPGQVFKITSTCMGSSYANNTTVTSTFTISSDTTIDGRTTGNNYNTYYGYTMDNIVQVISL